MKKSPVLLIAAVLMFASCGAVAQYASSDSGQQFQDGIYSNTPSLRTKAEKEEADNETQAMVEKTQASQIYLFGDRKDTVMIPQDMSAIIRYDQKLGGTTVTVGENPYDWRYDLENNYGYHYAPFGLTNSWYWSVYRSPWYWDSWTYSPWRYHYSGWYNPWYYGGWYDPWYYRGYWGWYDPWYSPYHCGWYDPYWGHHHHHHHYPGYGPGTGGSHKDTWHGLRGETGSERVFAGGSSLRGGLGSKSTISRNATGKGSSTASRTQSSGRTTAGRTAVSRGTATGTSGPEKVAAGRTTVTRTVPASRGTATSTSSGSSSRVATARKAPASGTVSNHRKPSITNIPGRTTTNATQGTDRYNVNTGTSARSTSSYERSSSSSSSPSYNRSSSSTSGRSGFSGGSSSGYSRGSSGSSSGGYSRSGSSGARR